MQISLLLRHRNSNRKSYIYHERETTDERGSFYAAGSNCHPACACPTENKCRRAILAFPAERHEPGFSGLQQHLFLCRQPGIVRHLHRQGDCPMETPATDAPPGIQCKHLPAPAPPVAGLPGDGLRQQSTTDVHRRTGQRTYPPHPYAYLAHRTERRCRRPHAHRKACRRTLLLESREDGQRYAVHLPIRQPAHPELSLAPGTERRRRTPADTDPLLERQRLHAGQGTSIQLHQARLGQLTQHQSRIQPRAERENLRLRRVRHRTEQSRTEGQPLCHRPTRARNPRYVQAHPLLLQQPWLRHVYAHFRPRDLRLRPLLHRSHQTLYGRRGDGHLHLSGLAKGDAERIHRTGRTARNAPFVELRHLDEPYHLLQRSRGPRRSPETA